MESHREVTPQSLRLVIGGVRGSSPVSGPAFARFGGATTSLLLQDPAGGDRVILDAGSGLLNLLPAIGEAPALLLLTHFHLDHLLGLPLFPRLFTQDNSPAQASRDSTGTPSLRIAAPAALDGGATLAQALSRLIAPPLWPVTPSARPADLLPPECAAPLAYGSFTIRWMPVPHPGGCLAYRVTHRPTSKSIVLATDLELRALAPDGLDALRAFCSGAGLLILDGQFDAAELPGHRGWGHSSWQDAAAFADSLRAPRLLITHHSPQAPDALLASRSSDLSARHPRYVFARQGQTIRL
jgi:phosphoribosyl 1,2-cyclic phosphodiesterase